MNIDSPIKPPSPVHAADDPLKEAEDLLAFGAWIWKPHSGTMEWSDGMYLLAGHVRSGNDESLSLEHLQELLPAEQREALASHMDKCVASGTPFRFTHNLNTVNGARLIVITRGKRIADHNGDGAVAAVTQELTGQAGRYDDITQQRNLMEQFELNLKFGTWYNSPHTKEINWSAGMYILFGYDPEKDRDLKIDEAVYAKHMDPEDYERGLSIRNDLQHKNEYLWQYRITTSKGEYKWLETYGYVIRDKEGNFVQNFGITRDITRLKMYEHSLESKINELNRSNAELEEFAYVASHDMQEPLRKLITFSERLTAKYSDVLQDEGKLYINRMLAATNNMRMLIDNLLDFSRIARTDEAFGPTDLNDVLRSTLTDLEVTLEETHAQVNAAKLPVIEALAPQMKQLFSNILSNALKFRKPSVNPVITIQCSSLPAAEAENLNLKADHYYKITISDNGIGFEQEYAERIFQIFQRLHGKAEYPGSGIGLAICKKIVDYHNGAIYARGHMHEGAAITIILPEKQ